MIKTEQSQHGTRKMGAKAAAGICSLTMLASIGLAESPASITTLTPADDAQRSHVLQLTPSPSATRPDGDAGGLAEDVNGEPEILFSSHDGYLLFQSGPPNGVAGLSNVNGFVDGEWLDRALIDDFILDGNAIVTAVGINGVWFEGTGGDTPLEGLRVRLWSATPDGLPGELLFDDFVPHEAVETGDVYFGRPEIVYIAHLPEFELAGGANIISIQPVGALDGFYQLTAASGQDEIFGIEVHVSYPDLDLPPWTPGHVVFDEYHDVVYTVWGEWIEEIETCEEWCGEQSPFGCWCDELCCEFDDCCEDQQDVCDLCDPGIDPYTCDGFCGGQTPGGCWCDEYCDDLGDCCDDVCEQCPDTEFCDPGIDPYTCYGFCGGEAPGGCWCDEACCEFGDCCEDKETACEFCDPGIDPYTCYGSCGGMAPGGCWCDEGCVLRDDCCEDRCESCSDVLCSCDPECDSLTCAGHCGGAAPGGCWCDAQCAQFDDCCEDRCNECPSIGECAGNPACPADVNGDDVVDGGDLLILLATWGPCPGCAADLNGDDIVDGGDLLIVLAAWGSCPPMPNLHSCEGSCSGQALGGCWCDEACCAFGDCCADAGESCELYCASGLGACCLSDGSCLEVQADECSIDDPKVSYRPGRRCDDIICQMHVTVPFDGQSHPIISNTAEYPHRGFLFSADDSNPESINIVGFGADGLQWEDGWELGPGDHLYVHVDDIVSFQAQASESDGQDGGISIENDDHMPATSYFDRECHVTEEMVYESNTPGAHAMKVDARNANGRSDCDIVLRYVIIPASGAVVGNRIVIRKGTSATLGVDVPEGAIVRFFVRCWSSLEGDDCRFSVQALPPFEADAPGPDDEREVPPSLAGSDFGIQECRYTQQTVYVGRTVGSHSVTASARSAAGMASDCPIELNYIVRRINEQGFEVTVTTDKVKIDPGASATLNVTVPENGWVEFVVRCLTSLEGDECRISTHVAPPHAGPMPANRFSDKECSRSTNYRVHTGRTRGTHSLDVTAANAHGDSDCRLLISYAVYAEVNPGAWKFNGQSGWRNLESGESLEEPIAVDVPENAEVVFTIQCQLSLDDGDCRITTRVSVDPLDQEDDDDDQD